MPPVSDPFYRMSSRLFTAEQKAMKQKFLSAKSVSEIIEVFNDLHRCFKESDLGLACGYVVQKLHNEEDEDSEKILTFGKQALGILLRDGSCMPVVGVLQMIGNSCSKLNRLEESFKYLTWAVRLLENIQETVPDPDPNVLTTLHAIRVELYRLRFTMGTNEGCISYMLKNLPITEKLWGKHSKKLAKENWRLSELYFCETKYQEAKPFCLKALELYLTCPGDNSEEIGGCSKQLGVIYSRIGENGTALDHNRLSQKLLKKSSCTFLSAEIEAADMLNKSGKCEEAVEALRDIIPRTEKHGIDRIIALTQLAEAFMNQEKIEDAKECALIVCGILSGKENSVPHGMAFVGIAIVYKHLNEFDTALSLLQRGLVLLQEETISLPMMKTLLFKCSKNLVPLLRLTGRTEEAIVYLTDEVETAKKSFGSKHLEVGKLYCALGSACFDTNKLLLSAQAFAYAKDVFDESLGPLHVDSIMICKSLYNTYRAMGSYSLAMTFLKEVMKRLDVLGPNAQVDLDEAAILMAELKKMVSDDVC